jgi:transposase InsO family protein
MTEAIYQEVSVKTEKAKEQHRRISVCGMLKYLDVSRSGYRAWQRREPSEQQKHREAMKMRIKEKYDASKGIYGAPKITQELRQEGEHISERTVGLYMRQMGLRAVWVKHWTVTTKDSDFSHKLRNYLGEHFNPGKPNAVWCTDITYIWTDGGFVYLTSVMDLYARRIIAWTLSRTMEVEHVVSAIEQAKRRRKLSNPLIIHSDRGSQYVSAEFRKAVTGMKHSFSKKAYPWDNACIESFHSLIKREWLNRFKIKDYEHARRLVFEYIESFYNTVRIHSHCDYMSPVQFEKLYQKMLHEGTNAA